MQKFFLAILAGSMLVGPSKAEGPKAKPVVVPFQLLKTQHMVVKAKINGKGPYRMIFDTGAPMNLLSNKVAKEANVLPKNFRPPLLAPFGSKGQFDIRLFEVGSLQKKNLPAVVMDHPTVKLMAQKVGPLEGIVGLPFFGRYRMTINYQAKVMTFVPGTYQPPDIMKEMTAALMGASKKPKPKLLAPKTLWGIEVAKTEKDAQSGIDIVKVYPGSPAAEAGIKVGDRLLVFDDRWTESVEDFYLAASLVQPGQEILLNIKRGEKELPLKITARAGL